MMWSLNLVLRLAIWFLLTSDGTTANIILGVAAALLLPHSRAPLGSVKEWLWTLGAIFAAVPRAYYQACRMVLFPHDREELTMERVKPQRTPALVFLDIFLITFTPTTMATRYYENGWYQVHRILPKERS